MNEKSFEEILLETAFFTMACDGDIAGEEVAFIKKKSIDTNCFGKLDVEGILNKNIDQLNKFGDILINRYLRLLKKEDFTTANVRDILALSAEMIYADSIVEYNEVRFFRNIKNNLMATDEMVLSLDSKYSELIGQEIFIKDFTKDLKGTYFSNVEEIEFKSISFS